VVRRPPAELKAMSRDLLRLHLGRRAKDNPVARFGQRFAKDLPWLTSQGLPVYHAWAFATVRQLGAACELAAAYVRWLGDAPLAPAADAFESISNGAKTFILKVARAINAKRSFDGGPLFEEMARAWQRGMDVLGGSLESAGASAHNSVP
jgi:hypothetical protein